MGLIVPLPGWATASLPVAIAIALGVAISLAVVDKIPEHAKKVAAGAWIVAGAAIGTIVAPDLGTVVGAGVGALVAWLMY
ncbi:MAG TPA: hypothetical protein VIJ16_11825 [Gemmatimonadaceae bacterium]